MDISKLVAFSDKLLFLDDDFPKRVLKTSMILSVVLAFLSVSLWSLEVTCGLALGMAFSIGLMRLLWWLTSVVFPVLVKRDIKNKEKELS